MPSPRAVVLLSELSHEYVGNAEDMLELAALYDVDLPWHSGTNPWLVAARFMVEQLNHGNVREYVDALVEQIEVRNHRAVVNSSFERLQYHEQMKRKLAALRDELGDPLIPREVIVSGGRRFSAKSHICEFFAPAETDLLVVDPYVGVGTLDCFRDVTRKIQLLTGTRDNAIEAGFDLALEQFRAEGRDSAALEATRSTCCVQRSLLAYWIVAQGRGEKRFPRYRDSGYQRGRL
ncbi:MAG TPA: hypothetical protein VF188_18570 [Longimicrobiales bacterium]